MFNLQVWLLQNSSLLSRGATSLYDGLTPLIRRRKVKCDEQRPRCSHCERLNMECKWPPRHNPGSRRRQHEVAIVGSDVNRVPPSPFTEISNNSTSPSHTSPFHPLQAVDEVFDYASFMWDSRDFWQQSQPDIGQTSGLDAHLVLQDATPHVTFSESTLPSGAPESSTRPSSAVVPELPISSDCSSRLMEYFAHSAIPPILAEVETQKKWLAIRQVVMEMADTSDLVRCAILAFSNVLLSRSNSSVVPCGNNHYEGAAVAMENLAASSFTQHSHRRECLLAALFFLTYVDILESNLSSAHSNLERAYRIFQQGHKQSFVAVEKQFLLWLRLLDGRAVSAGGEGLFLSKDDELLLVEASPATIDGDLDDASRDDLDNDGIEDVLFQVLYQPGIVFYQRVQSFMGRISKIDPWHRSRGTVEDETEVMNIGASIAADLRMLYDQRPPLMDYAVAGKLTEPHVSAHLSFAITRAFRTYLSNYYASKVHLHRVAYKSLPLTREASEALNHIRRLARLIVDGLGPEDTLPVNMLWPLLMLGVEEQDLSERGWIRAQILRMEKVAGNAKITAQVLEEVQVRQDASKARVDIRSVMHAVFSACFAIL